MEKYKVVVIQQSLRNNKVAKFGEIVEESQLPSPAKELIEKGFIVSYESEKAKAKAEAEAEAKADAAEKTRLADEKAKADAEKENVNLEAESETNAETENIEVVLETVKKEVKPKK